MMNRIITIIALILAITGASLLPLSIGSKSMTQVCIDGVLNNNVTCVFPGYAAIKNMIYGNALISIDGNEPVPLSNGSVIAHKVTYMPISKKIIVNNETQVTFNIFNPTSKWVNITLPGTCLLTINVTLLGSGYVSITAISNNETVVHTPYTYSLLTIVVIKNDLDVLIRPAIPLSCPCINTITLVRINGTCIQQETPIVKAVAHVTLYNINMNLLLISIALIIASAMLLIGNIVISRST